MGWNLDFKAIYDFLFNFIIILLVIQMIAGIIIDTFAVLREEEAEKKEQPPHPAGQTDQRPTQQTLVPFRVFTGSLHSSFEVEQQEDPGGREEVEEEDPGKGNLDA